ERIDVTTYLDGGDLDLSEWVQLFCQDESLADLEGIIKVLDKDGDYLYRKTYLDIKVDVKLASIVNTLRKIILDNEIANTSEDSDFKPNWLEGELDLNTIINTFLKGGLDIIKILSLINAEFTIVTQGSSYDALTGTTVLTEENTLVKMYFAGSSYTLVCDYVEIENYCEYVSDSTYSDELSAAEKAKFEWTGAVGTSELVKYRYNDIEKVYEAGSGAEYALVKYFPYKGEAGSYEGVRYSLNYKGYYADEYGKYLAVVDYDKLNSMAETDRWSNYFENPYGNYVYDIVNKVFVNVAELQAKYEAEGKTLDLSDTNKYSVERFSFDPVNRYRNKYGVYEMTPGGLNIDLTGIGLAAYCIDSFTLTDIANKLFNSGNSEAVTTDGDENEGEEENKSSISFPLLPDNIAEYIRSFVYGLQITSNYISLMLHANYLNVIADLVVGEDTTFTFDFDFNKRSYLRINTDTKRYHFDSLVSSDDGLDSDVLGAVRLQSAPTVTLKDSYGMEISYVDYITDPDNLIYVVLPRMGDKGNYVFVNGNTELIKLSESEKAFLSAYLVGKDDNTFNANGSFFDEVYYKSEFTDYRTGVAGAYLTLKSTVADAEYTSAVAGSDYITYDIYRINVVKVGESYVITYNGQTKTYDSLDAFKQEVGAKHLLTVSVDEEVTAPLIELLLYVFDNYIGVDIQTPNLVFDKYSYTTNGANTYPTSSTYEIVDYFGTMALTSTEIASFGGEGSDSFAETTDSELNVMHAKFEMVIEDGQAGGLRVAVKNANRYNVAGTFSGDPTSLIVASVGGTLYAYDSYQSVFAANSHTLTQADDGEWLKIEYTKSDKAKQTFLVRIYDKDELNAGKLTEEVNFNFYGTGSLQMDGGAVASKVSYYRWLRFDFERTYNSNNEVVRSSYVRENSLTSMITADKFYSYDGGEYVYNDILDNYFNAQLYVKLADGTYAYYNKAVYGELSTDLVDGSTLDVYVSDVNVNGKRVGTGEGEVDANVLKVGKCVVTKDGDDLVKTFVLDTAAIVWYTDEEGTLLTEVQSSLTENTTLYAKVGDSYVCLAYYDKASSTVKAFERFDELKYMNVMEMTSMTAVMGGTFSLSGDYSSTALSNVLYSVFGDLATSLTISEPGKKLNNTFGYSIALNLDVNLDAMGLLNGSGIKDIIKLNNVDLAIDVWTCKEDGSRDKQFIGLYYLDGMVYADLSFFLSDGGFFKIDLGQDAVEVIVKNLLSGNEASSSDGTIRGADRDKAGFYIDIVLDMLTASISSKLIGMILTKVTGNDSISETLENLPNMVPYVGMSVAKGNGTMFLGVKIYDTLGTTEIIDVKFAAHGIDTKYSHMMFANSDGYFGNAKSITALTGDLFRTEYLDEDGKIAVNIFDDNSDNVKDLMTNQATRDKFRLLATVDLAKIFSGETSFSEAFAINWGKAELSASLELSIEVLAGIINFSEEFGALLDADVMAYIKALNSTLKEGADNDTYINATLTAYVDLGKFMNDKLSFVQKLAGAQVNLIMTVNSNLLPYDKAASEGGEAQDIRINATILFDEEGKLSIYLDFEDLGSRMALGEAFNKIKFEGLDISGMVDNDKEAVIADEAVSSAGSYIDGGEEGSTGIFGSEILNVLGVMFKEIQVLKDEVKVNFMNTMLDSLLGFLTQNQTLRDMVKLPQIDKGGI
ncbi:MAG: hypothetical protein ACI4QU_05295, partial [Christensenellales bacterium]